MSYKIILVVFVCGIYMCSATPVPQNVSIGDDKSNWEALWNATKDNPPVSRSGDESVFDMIVRLNAQARGNGTARSDEDVFLFEGDIVMNKTEAIEIIQNNTIHTNGTSRKKRAVIRTRRQNLWPKNVPYAIDATSSHVTAQIKAGIAKWEIALPCLGKWQDVTGYRRKPNDYMYFFRGSGCYSQVGRVGGPQRISIGNGCEQLGVVIHEIGHAMGLWHEQSRPDRDSYVSILWNNIIPATKFNFQKHSTSRINSFGVSYDYGSVMHYGAYAFSSNGRATIRSKPDGRQRLGQRNGLSVKDIQQLRKLYNCTTGPSVCKADVQTASNCKRWKGSGFCDHTHVTYMKEKCCKTCGTTTPAPTTKPTTRPPKPSVCKADVESVANCQYWKGLGYCHHTHVKYMEDNCCKTCVCKADVQTASNCKRWQGSGFCDHTYATYMKENCCKTCSCPKANVLPDWICKALTTGGFCQGTYAKYMKENCCITC